MGTGPSLLCSKGIWEGTVTPEPGSACILGSCSEKGGFHSGHPQRSGPNCLAPSLIAPQSPWQDWDSHVSSLSGPPLWLLLCPLQQPGSVLQGMTDPVAGMQERGVHAHSDVRLPGPFHFAHWLGGASAPYITGDLESASQAFPVPATPSENGFVT